MEPNKENINNFKNGFRHCIHGLYCRLNTR
jgi:hypothetical protein